MMSRDNMISLYRQYTETRIYSIRASKSCVIPNGGTAYFISNKGKSSNEGKSVETPLLNLNDLNRLSLKNGDVVYFGRVGIWRGSINSKYEEVTY